MKNKGYLWIITGAMLLFGCKKNTSSPQIAETYLPSKAGNQWTYQYSNFKTGASGSMIVVATNNDSTINGKPYRVFTSTGNPNTYFYQSNTNYFQYGVLAGIEQSIELNFLRSDLNKGQSWDESIATQLVGIPGTITVKTNHTILDKGVSETWLGETYDGVIKVKTVITEIQIPGLPAIIPTGSLELHYARNIGRIYSRSKITIVIPAVNTYASDEESILKAYTVVL